MATGQLSSVLRHIHKLAAVPGRCAPTDAELLDRFATGHEEAAFATLVERHGPMVWGVCRRVLRNLHDAEDAFQATFLILVRKAAAIRNREALGCWLHRVAQHTALRARDRAATRRTRERRVSDMAQDDFITTIAWRELQPILDEEVQRLPEKYRVPFVLCYLQGATYEQAAAQLGSQAGTISHRLGKARQLLRARLTRRGLSLPVGVLAAALAANAAPAALPARLAEMTIQTALGGLTRAAASVAVLVTGGLQAMNMTRVKLLTALLLLISLLAAGAGRLTHEALAQKGPGDPIPAQGNGKGKEPALPGAKGPDKKENLVVTGQVLGKEDKPVADADVAVIVLGRSTEPGTFKHEVLLKGKTDKDGKFRLVKDGVAGRDFFEIHILAHAKGYGLGWADLLGTSSRPLRPPVRKKDVGTVIQLSPEQVVKGRLLNLEGQSAANVKCRVASAYVLKPGERPLVRSDPMDFMTLHQRRDVLYFPDDLSAKDWPWLPATFTTDKEGRFALSGFGQGQEVAILVQDDRFALQELDLRTGEKGNAKEISLSLAPAQFLEGKVVYEDTKKPVPEAWVNFNSFTMASGNPLPTRKHNNQTVRTDAEGRFRVNLFLGDRFHVHAAPRKGEPYLALGRSIDWPKGAVKQTITLALPRGVLLDGALTEKQSGKGVGKVRVIFRPRSEGKPQRDENFFPRDRVTVTNADGSFKLVVPQELGYLLCTAPGNDFVRKMISVEEVAKGQAGGDRTYYHAVLPLNPKLADSPKKIAMQLVRGVTLRGKVIGPDGKAVSKGVVFCGGDLLGPQINPSREIGKPVDASYLRWVSLKDGAFELPNCDPEKTYRILVVDNPGQEGGGVMKVNPGANRVLFYPGGFDSSMMLNGLLRDTPGRIGAVAEVSAKQAGEKPITVKLQPCGKAVVRFVDDKGKPAKAQPWLELIITPKQGKVQPEWVVLGSPHGVFAPQITLTPDKEGKVTIPGLIPGATYRIRGFDKGGRELIFDREFTAESGNTLKLDDIQVEK
jgi:RNA polymerase sigma factor (sigma-70 family)